jgi:hypothetical protein
LVPRFGVEGKIYLCDGMDPSQFWTLDKATQSVSSPDKSITLQVFGKVTVEISMDDSKKHAPKVVFKCLDPPLHKPSGTPYSRVIKEKVEGKKEGQGERKKEQQPTAAQRKEKPTVKKASPDSRIQKTAPKKQQPTKQEARQEPKRNNDKKKRKRSTSTGVQPDNSKKLKQ